MALIDIVLATYNGAEYLDQQIASLLAQTHADLRILVRDDGSTDATPAILQGLEQANAGRLHILRDSLGNLGPASNFAALLGASDAPYVMFCDQDDVWDADKVAVTLAAMHAAEAANPGAPVLVHTDVKIVDSGLNFIADSYYRYMHIKPVGALPGLFFENTVIGCTAMINRRLAEMALPIPAGAVMHDWWLALLAANFGVLRFVDRPTLAYRQHAANQIGAFKYGLAMIGEVSAARLRKVSDNYRRAVNQALLFEATYGARISEINKPHFRLVHDLATGGWLARRRSALRHGIGKSGMLRTALFYAVM